MKRSEGANMVQWNPEQYLKFQQERTQPAIDLSARIDYPDAKSVIDIGCGPGNSTRILREKWPEASITGLDSSPEMINMALKDCPEQIWITADASAYEFSRTYDVVFSNAAIQWIHGQERLIENLSRIINEKGVLAVQVPANSHSPLHLALDKVSELPEWKQYCAECRELLNYRDAYYYYPILKRLFSGVEIWETTYYHILDSHQDMMEWYKGTGMKPFLDRIPEAGLKEKFEEKVLSEARDYYPVQNDGKILFQFPRLFFIAMK
jgi:trans-aconitate 2-methyltransferase